MYIDGVVTSNPIFEDSLLYVYGSPDRRFQKGIPCIDVSAAESMETARVFHHTHPNTHIPPSLLTAYIAVIG